MKYTKCIKAIFAFLLLLTVAQNAVAEETIHITTGEFPPWSSESLKHHGITSHIISEAFKLEGYKVKFTFFPWSRVYELAKDGKEYQATSYWYPSDERAKEFHYSDALQTDKMVFFHLKDKPLPNWETLDDFKDMRIGATREYTYTKEFWDAKESGRLDIEIANTDELNFKKLLKGRIDTFPTGPLSGQKVLRESFGMEAAGTVTFHSKPLVAPTAHLLFSKQLENGKELVNIFNKGLSKLRESGRYTELQNDLVAGRYEQ